MSSHRETTTWATATTGTTTGQAPKPAGLAAGDAMTALVLVINNSTTNSWSELGLPTDWFLIAEANSGSGNYNKAFLVGGIASGSEGSTIDFTYTGPGGASDTFCIMGALNARSGHDTTVPWDHTVNETNTATGGSTTTLVRTGAGWTTNQHAGRILKNTTTGKYSYIASNTSDTLTLRHAMSSANANAHGYQILTFAAAGQYDSATGDAGLIAPDITKVVTTGQLLSFYAGGNGNDGSFGANWTPPGGQTERAEVNIDSRGGWGRVMQADEAFTTSGATGTRTATGSAITSLNFNIALREPQGGTNLKLLRNVSLTGGVGIRL